MKTVLLKAPILSKSGYGEHARFVYRALKARPDYYDVHVMPITWGKSGWLLDSTEETLSIMEDVEKINRNPQQVYDLSVQVTIPNEWQKHAKVNIGVTAGIETDRVTPEWLQKANEMDKIVVVSQHAKNVFEKTNYDMVDPQTNNKMGTLKCEPTVEVVGYPVKDIKPDQKILDYKFSTKFNFLTVAQWGPRKDLEGTIKGFLDEFQHNPDVGFVVKTYQANMSIIDRRQTDIRLQTLLGEYPDRKCKIHYIHGSLSEEEMQGLYNHPQIEAYVTTTHGEGFGLPLFESAYSGLPVVCPGWSGHVDFLSADTGKKSRLPCYTKIKHSLAPVAPQVVWKTVIGEDHQWCYVDEAHYRKTLRDFYEKNSKVPVAKRQAKVLKEWLADEFSEDKQYSLMQLHLSGESKMPPVVKSSDLPKISIITSVYDGDEFIEEFMEDITRQTIFEDKCELILIDANSPGNEKETIDKYLERYPDNIVYKKLDKDPGIYGVWNMGVELATGEYLTNANLDDRKHPKSLEEHARGLYGDPDVDLVYATSYLTHKPNQKFEDKDSDWQLYAVPDFSKEAMIRGNPPHQNPMWRKSLHDTYGMFDDQYRSAGDWEMWLRAVFGGSKFKKINGVLGLYYFNPTGISTDKGNDEWKKKEEFKIFKTYQKKFLAEAK